MVKDGIQIGVVLGKTVDSNGYGQFYDGLTNGIPIKPMINGKVQNAVYFIRTEPKVDGTVYTAAGKRKKITVKGEQKAPRYQISLRTIKLKKAISSTQESSRISVSFQPTPVRRLRC